MKKIKSKTSEQPLFVQCHWMRKRKYKIYYFKEYEFGALFCGLFFISFWINTILIYSRFKLSPTISLTNISGWKDIAKQWQDGTKFSNLFEKIKKNMAVMHFCLFALIPHCHFVLIHFCYVHSFIVFNLGTCNFVCALLNMTCEYYCLFHVPTYVCLFFHVFFFKSFSVFVILYFSGLFSLFL